MQLLYKIAKLWGKPEGSSEKFDLDEKIVFPEDSDLEFSSNFTGKLTFINLKDEISALLNDAEIDVKFSCTQCLKNFTSTVKIPSAEREFFLEQPDLAASDLDDFFFIDKKRMTIDLDELVRQEIILHFPLIPVCSKGCKGLCQVCGTDRNKAKCKCRPLKEAASESHQPFKNLKQIAKRSAEGSSTA